MLHPGDIYTVKYTIRCINYVCVRARVCLLVLYMIVNSCLRSAAVYLPYYVYDVFPRPLYILWTITWSYKFNVTETL